MNAHEMMVAYWNHYERTIRAERNIGEVVRAGRLYRWALARYYKELGYVY